MKTKNKNVIRYTLLVIRLTHLLIALCPLPFAFCLLPTGNLFSQTIAAGSYRCHFSKTTLLRNIRNKKLKGDGQVIFFSRHLPTTY